MRNSMLQQAINALAQRESLTIKETRQVVNGICANKRMATNLINELHRHGYLDRRDIVTPKARARAA